MRPEIQGLRALAVGLVLVFHLWPNVVPGGYVGVDVFFVISGFLITQHLLREAESTGTVGLAAFWARRARRLLPASLLVLAASAAATVALVPISLWDQFLGEIRASALYVENWQLAGAAVDYLASADPPSPVRHFWSLSAEEQFYAVWPLLVAGALLLAGGAGPQAAKRRRFAIGVVLGGVTLGSFAWGLQITAGDPAAAYFVTPARAWEFGAGGLLALVAAAGPTTLLPQARAALAWLGVGAILAAAVLFGARTPFPGVAALLPVLGALALLHAGAPAVAWSPSRVLSLRPAQRLGDWSYAIYLWHWPLIVLLPYALQRPLDDLTAVGIAAASVALAAVTKVLVEDPVRSGRLLAPRRPAYTLAAATLGVLVVLGVTVQGEGEVKEEIRAAEIRTARTLAAPPDCFGAAARDPRRSCTNPKLQTMVVPTPAEVRYRRNSKCERGDERISCGFGVPAEDAAGHVALIGDSHAAHWRAALAVVARKRRWHGYSVTRTGCAFSTVARPSTSSRRMSNCVDWVKRLPGWFAQHPEISTVFISQISHNDDYRTFRQGYAEALRTLPDTVERIVVLRDPPMTSPDTAACVERAMQRGRDAGRDCAQPKSEMLSLDPVVGAARSGRIGRRTQVVDLTRVFCGRKTCLPVIGGVLVYRDQNHLSRTFARTLGPLVDRALR